MAELHRPPRSRRVPNTTPSSQGRSPGPSGWHARKDKPTYQRCGLSGTNDRPHSAQKNGAKRCTQIWSNRSSWGARLMLRPPARSPQPLKPSRSPTSPKFSARHRAHSLETSRPVLKGDRRAQSLLRGFLVRFPSINHLFQLILHFIHLI